MTTTTTTIAAQTSEKIKALLKDEGWSWEGIKHECVRKEIRQIFELELPGFGEELLADWLATLNQLGSLEYYIERRKNWREMRHFAISFMGSFVQSGRR